VAVEKKPIPYSGSAQGNPNAVFCFVGQTALLLISQRVRRGIAEI